MKKIEYWQRDIPNAKTFIGLLKEDVGTKFIVLSGEYNIELHFPKALYTYKALEVK